MCGLIAFFSPGPPVDEATLAAAGRALRHRGPDGNGRFLSPDRRVALWHTRLSVIDLDGGAQPLCSEDGQVHLILNGELYGHAAQRAALQARGHRFRTRSDSEVALHLYEDHGVDFVRLLRGEFAFCLWDARRRLLVCGRDRFGVKPLCYAWIDGVLVLASEVKALLAAGLPPAWDGDAVFHALSLQYLLPAQTLFAGARQLPPGHVLSCGDGGVQLQRYFDLDYPPDGADAPLDEDAARERLLASLDEAVRERLVADVPVACQLSGGLDSSAVLGLAMRHTSAPVPCFTVRFHEPAYDELAVAQETAARVGAPLHVVDATPAALAAHLPAAVAHGETLSINTHIAAKYLLSRAVRDAGYKVILTGEGADEVMAGYAHLRGDLLTAAARAQEAQAELGAALVLLLRDNPVTAGIHLPDGETLPLEAVRAALSAVPTFLAAKAGLGLRMRAVLGADFVAQHQGADPAAALLASVDVAGQLVGRHPVHQALYLWTKLALANYILRPLGDCMEMAHGVEGRLPFLDHQVFAVARDLPVSLKIRVQAQQGHGPRLIEKYLLREATRPVLTETVYRRAKHPFMAPPLWPTGAVDDPLRQLVQDTLRSRGLGDLPFFDQRRVLALLDALPGLSPAERVATDPVLLLVFSAVILKDHYRLH